MSSLEVNKVAAAVLTAGIAGMGAMQLGNVLVRPYTPAESALRIVAAAPAAVAAPVAAALEPVGPLLAAANPQAGQVLSQRLCASCHSFNEGGRNGVGPNLYGIVGAAHAQVAGFNYSASLKAKAGPWDDEALNAWLAKPTAYAAGNRMAFAGINSAPQRADVIAYLRSVSPAAPKLP